MTKSQGPMTNQAQSPKAQKLEKLNQVWAEKDLPLKAAATHDVPGEGNPDADVIFVGEGPGAEEDKQGRPFVGAAGKLLTQLIESIGWTREDVFIANIIKHRPPGNRDPLPMEIEAYTPWLDGQLRIIEPKLLVTLGRYSMEYFLGPGLSISKVHGQPKRKDERVIMPMYHPAAALYQGSLRPVLEADFKKITKVLEMIQNGMDQEDQPASAEATEGEQVSLL